MKKQIMALALCFAFLLTTVAGVIGSGELSLGYKVSDSAENFELMTDTSDDFQADSDFESKEEYAVEENSSASDVTDYGSVSQSDRVVGNDPCIPYTPVASRVVTKKAELYVETENYEKLAEFIVSKVKYLYGHVESSNEYDYEGKSGRSGFMTIRIPTEDLDAFVTSIESETTVRTKTVKTDDITSDYVDTESKIAALENEQATLLSLLSKANSLSETIQIQDRLTDVRSELQYYEAMKLRMDNEVQYSSVYIDIKEVDHESSSGNGFWYDLKNGFIDSLYDVAEGFKIMTIWFVSALPFVAILLACGIIVKTIVKVFKRKKSEKSDRGEQVADSVGGQADS